MGLAFTRLLFLGETSKPKQQPQKDTVYKFHISITNYCKVFHLGPVLQSTDGNVAGGITLGALGGALGGGRLERSRDSTGFAWADVHGSGRGAHVLNGGIRAVADNSLEEILLGKDAAHFGLCHAVRNVSAHEHAANISVFQLVEHLLFIKHQNITKCPLLKK